MMEENILSIRKAKTQVTLRSFRILNGSLALKQITHLRIFKTKIHLDSRREPDHESVEMEEAKLIQLARQGDLSAFNGPILNYQNQVFNHAYRLLENDDAAEDITQSTFILAFQKFYQFRGGAFRAWLLKIATNLCYDEMRTWNRAPIEPLEPINDEGQTNESPYWIKDSNLLPEETIEMSELREGIEHGLSQLPFNFRSAVILVDAQELSYQEAAFAMSTSIGTLKSRLARGRVMLRNALIRMDPDPQLSYQSAKFWE